MFNRRAFVAGASALALLGPIRASVGQGATGTRRSMRNLGANDPDLAAYRRGVAAMKALPPSDPRNWVRFADIHRDFCPHGNWYFLPWHRAYLVALEGIIRDLARKPDFALPYWDWTAQRQLPRAFTEGNPRTNPLNHSRPGMSAQTSLPDDMVGPQVMSRVLASPDFEAFGSARPRGQNGTGAQWQRRVGAKTEFEFNPHDGVHGTVGGDMAQVATASRDPIFYLHHANVDRIWAMWNARGNANSPETMWRNFAFNRNFIDASGRPWNVAVGELQSPAALGYRYDDDEGPFAADLDFAGTAAAADDPVGTALRAYRRLSDNMAPRAMGALQRVGLPTGGAFYVAAADNDRAAAHERSISIPVPLGRPLAEIIKAEPMAAPPTPERRRDRQRVFALLRDIEPPSEPSTRVRVFVNREGAEPARPSDPHYVTSMSFFGAGHGAHDGAGHHGHAGHRAHAASATTSVCVDLTPTLSRLRGSRPFRGDKITVQLAPFCRYANRSTSLVRPRRVEIAIL